MDKYHGLVVSVPRVMMGKPVIAGTGITVELILEKLAAGETVEQILDAHPRLTRGATQASMAFAAVRPCGRALFTPAGSQKNKTTALRVEKGECLTCP